MTRDPAIPLSISILWCVIFFTLLAGVRAAAAQTFELSSGKIQIAVPPGWQSVSNLYGIPLAVLGPDTHERRAVVEISSTGRAPASLNPEGLRRTQSEFQAGREEWIEEMRGEVLNFIDFERPQWPGAENVVSVGYRYRLNETDFEEMTYLVTCGTKLYHLTTLLVVSEIPERGGEVRSIVQSFSCR